MLGVNLSSIAQTGVMENAFLGIAFRSCKQFCNATNFSCIILCSQYRSVCVCHHIQGSCACKRAYLRVCDAYTRGEVYKFTRAYQRQVSQNKVKQQKNYKNKWLAN